MCVCVCGCVYRILRRSGPVVVVSLFISSTLTKHRSAELRIGHFSMHCLSMARVLVVLSFSHGVFMTPESSRKCFW